jgi:hypothetical protein
LGVCGPDAMDACEDPEERADAGDGGTLAGRYGGGGAAFAYAEGWEICEIEWRDETGE